MARSHRNADPKKSAAVPPAHSDPVPEMPVGTPDLGHGKRHLTLLLVDDHAILRQGLRALLELESDIEIVGEAGTFEAALECATRLQPDVVLSDIGLPGRSGLVLARELRKVCPETRVVLLTAHGTEEYIRAGLDSQADGYVLKDSDHSELLTAIRTVAAGKRFLCNAVASLVLTTYLHGGAKDSAQDPLRGVTGRERQVLTRIACGHSNKSVARDLNLSVKTIEKHRANLMRKLSLHNAADITRFALHHHMVAGEGPGSLAVEDRPARTGS